MTHNSAVEPSTDSVRRFRWGAIAAWTVVLGMTLISGWLHGRMTQRWGSDRGMLLAAQRLQRFPEQFGVWQQESTYDLGQSAMDLLQCKGYIHRGYRNRETGDYVKLAIMVGPGAKMSIHVPEICYEASNFTLLGPRQRFLVNLDQQQHAFWSVRFQVNDVSERRVHVLYGWSAGQEWLAPRMPRWSVAGCPLLYKLQLSHINNDLQGIDLTRDEQLLQGFVSDVLTILRDQQAEVTVSEERVVPEWPAAAASDA